MKLGKMPKAGDIILTNVQFTDTSEVKKRPALILFSLSSEKKKKVFDELVERLIDLFLLLQFYPFSKIYLQRLQIDRDHNLLKRACVYSTFRRYLLKF